MNEPLVRNFGNRPDSERLARRFAASATRQARKGIRYVAGKVGESWVVRRITDEEVQA